MKRIEIILVVGCMLLSGCTSNVNTDVVSKEVIPTEVPTQLPTELPAEIPEELRSQIQSEISGELPIKMETEPPANDYIEHPDGTYSMKYVEHPDGTYSTNRYTYQYKLRVSGRMPNAESDGTFEVLTNKASVTYYEVAWSLLSSQSSDWLDEKETVIIGMY